MENEEAYLMGFSAKSVFDNPFWKCYPKDSSVEDESLARHWVDGYVAKIFVKNDVDSVNH